MDQILNALEGALRTVFSRPVAARPCPEPAGGDSTTLDEAQRREAIGLMRVNHVGEVCAQALYSAQALSTRNAGLRRQFHEAAREETDHLAWTRSRLDQLGGRASVLNPLWYAGAFGMGLLAGRLGDRASLGFLMETERQVEAHLAGHLERLPGEDHASRAIVMQMKEDESLHAEHAANAGADEVPARVRGLMKGAASVMTTTARYL